MALANEVAFSNVLVTMRPSTKTSELPTRYLVRTTITNKFVDFLNGLRDDLSRAPGNISIAWDSWTAPHTSDPFLGMLVLWIQIGEDGTLSMRDEVGAFHKIFGSHTGVNLGRYLLLFLDRICVTSKSHNKVSLSSSLRRFFLLCGHGRELLRARRDLSGTCRAGILHVY